MQVAPTMRPRSSAQATAEWQWPFDPQSYPVYAIIGILIVIDFGVVLATDVWLRWDDRTVLFALACWLAGCGLLARSRGCHRIATILEAISLPGIMGAMTVALTVILCRFAVPMADPMLAAWDHALGLDWVGLLHVFQNNPALAAHLDQAYITLPHQYLLLTLALALIGQHRLMWSFLAAYGIAALITALIFPLFPAVGPYVHYGIPPAQTPYPADTWPWHFGPRIEAIRQNGFTDLLGAMGGLVTFPSFHTTAGVLFIWITWRSLPARLFFVPLNVALIAATPIRGAHYFVDLIGGILVAGLGIWLAGVILRKSGLAK